MGARRMDWKMETRPHSLAEIIVRALVPPASREHVLGDLHERNSSTVGYVRDALSALPFIIASRLRRTTNPIGFGFLVVWLWFAVFYGNFQTTWVVAAIPAFLAAATLAMRDVYRTPNPKLTRQAFFDVVGVALVVALSQGILAIWAPRLLLSAGALSIGLPLGCVILFFVRLQFSGAPFVPPKPPREMSMEQLAGEVHAYQATLRRVIRIEIGAAFVVVASFTLFLYFTPTILGKVGCALSACGGLFVAWFLHRHARVRPFPDGLAFSELAGLYGKDLERRADVARHSLWWYVVPVLIGPLVLMVGPSVARFQLRPQDFLYLALTALMGFFICAAHLLSARKARTRAEQLATLKEIS